MSTATKPGVLAVLRGLAVKAAKGDVHKVGHHYAAPWTWESPPFGPKCKRPKGTYAVMRVETHNSAVSVADFPSRKRAEEEAARLNGSSEVDTAIAAVAELIAERDALRRALAEYPKLNPHQLQARKVCVGVAALADKEARHG